MTTTLEALPAAVKRQASAINLYDLRKRKSRAAFLEASRQYRPLMWVTTFTAHSTDRPIDLSRPVNLDRLLEVLEPPMYFLHSWDCVKTMVRPFELKRPRSLLRGAYDGSLASGRSPKFISCLILDIDRPEMLKRPVEFFHIDWTTARHTPSNPRRRILVPLRPSVDERTHDALVSFFLDGTPEELAESSLRQAALLPVRVMRCQPRNVRRCFFEMHGFVGPVLDYRTLQLDVPLPVDLPADPPARPAPPGGHRAANALKADVHLVCKYLGIDLPKSFIARYGKTSKINVSCPFGHHRDDHPSTSLRVFGGDPRRDIWLKCFSHKTDGASQSMPIGRLYWLRHFRRKGPKTFIPTKPQQVLYNCRLLYVAGASDRPSEFPWSLDFPQLLDHLVAKGAVLVPAGDKRPQRIQASIGGKVITLNTSSLRNVYNGLNMLFCCKAYLFGEFDSTLAARFMSEWCQLGQFRGTYSKALTLLLHFNLLEPVGSTDASKLRPIFRNGKVRSREKQLPRTTIFTPIRI